MPRKERGRDIDENLLRNILSNLKSCLSVTIGQSVNFFSRLVLMILKYDLSMIINKEFRISNFSSICFP